MAEFLKDSQVATAIEGLIEDAKDFIFLISPYIKLHDRIKDKLKLKRSIPSLEIVIVFGKNEEDTSKSLSPSDFEFLKSFPNISIGYERRLHAKFYASETQSIISSMNLHEFSANNNIEIGIRLKTKPWLQAQISSDIDQEATRYFSDVIDNCELIYKNEPKFKTALFGLTSSYSHSEVVVDNAELFFTKKDSFSGRKYKQYAKPETINPQIGFCIRTGVEIPYNPAKPLSKEAFESWNRYKNKDFPEKYCHKTGKPSNGKTSLRNPIL